MKTKHYIFIVIGIILLVLFALMFKCVQEGGYYRAETDEERVEPPFGHVLFDSILVNSIDKGYEVTDSSISTLLTNGENLHKTILCVEPYIELNPEEVNDFLLQGGSLLIVTDHCNSEFADVFDFTIVSPSALDNSDVTEMWDIPTDVDSITATYIADKVFDNQDYRMSGFLTRSSIMESSDNFWNVRLTTRPDSLSNKRADNSTTAAIASFYYKQFGGGVIVICCMPRLFTNYGIMENNNCHLVFRLLSLCGNRSVVRTINPLYEEEKMNFDNGKIRYGDSDEWRTVRETIRQHLQRRGDDRPTKDDEDEASEEEEQLQEQQPSIIEHILSDPSLSTALYLSLFGILLFVFFTARRKQRLIPVIKPHKNGQLEFIKQIGSMHYRRESTDKMIDKKYVSFARKIRETLDIDITVLNPSNQEEAFARIATYTHLPQKEISELITELNTFMSYLRNLQTSVINELSRTYGVVPKEKYEQQMSARCEKPEIKQMIQWIDKMKRIEEKL